jgi:hypothetical protein
MSHDGALASSQDRSAHEDPIRESQSSEDVEVLDGTGLAVGRAVVPELNPGVGWCAFAGSILAQFVADSCFQAGQNATPSYALLLGITSFFSSLLFSLETRTAPDKLSSLLPASRATLRPLACMPLPSRGRIAPPKVPAWSRRPIRYARPRS